MTQSAEPEPRELNTKLTKGTKAESGQGATDETQIYTDGRPARGRFGIDEKMGDRNMRSGVRGNVAAGMENRISEHGSETRVKAGAPPELYQVVIECRNEGQQRELFERLRGEGLKVRLLVL